MKHLLYKYLIKKKVFLLLSNHPHPMIQFSKNTFLLHRIIDIIVMDLVFHFTYNFINLNL